MNQFQYFTTEVSNQELGPAPLLAWILTFVLLVVVIILPLKKLNPYWFYKLFGSSTKDQKKLFEDLTKDKNNWQFNDLHRRDIKIEQSGWSFKDGKFIFELCSYQRAARLKNVTDRTSLLGNKLSHQLYDFLVDLENERILTPS